jgi:DNA polymerase-3 subunit delta'
VNAERLPWHEGQWRRIVAMQAGARLPHALLLRGPEGVGKLQFAHHLVMALLCERDAFEIDPCGACRGCRLASASPPSTAVARRWS